jgi:hypothetical protein
MKIKIRSGGPQIKGGRFQVKCAEINYFPKKMPALKWPGNKEKALKTNIFGPHTNPSQMF